MKTRFLKEFEQRAKEVDLYFDFLSTILDNHVCLLLNFDKEDSNQKLIDADIQQILKANLFILLYNLAEFSIKKAIQAIYDALENDHISYKLANEKIKKIYLKNLHKRLKESNSITFAEVLTNLLTDTLNEDVIKLDENSIPIEGNLDARKLKELATIYGFSDHTSKAQRAGSDLLTVKTNRNILAHGNISFIECGRDYDLFDLKKIKDEVIFFLEDILNNIDQYIEKKEYTSINSTFSRNS